MLVKVIIILAIILGSLFLINLAVFFMLRTKLIRKKSNCNEAFDVLKEFYYNKNKNLDSIIKSYEEHFEDKQKVNTTLVELKAIDIDLNIQTIKEYCLNVNLLNKKENVTSFLLENTSAKENPEAMNNSNVLVTINNEIQLAEKYYDYTVSIYNDYITSFPYNVVAKISKFEQFVPLKEIEGNNLFVE